MSFNDDECDFCGEYIDPIGCDTAHMVGGKYWDGQCVEGMRSLWDRHSDATLEQMIHFFQGRYDADPIDWDAGVEQTPAAAWHRISQLYNRDTANQMREFLNSRNSKM